MTEHYPPLPPGDVSIPVKNTDGNVIGWAVTTSWSDELVVEPEPPKPWWKRIRW